MSQHTPKSYSYEDCYHTLGLSPNCEWSDVRLAYKKLIQKWHPDRYVNKPAEKIAADGKIKTINIAYHQLSTYYRKNKTLPSVSLNEKNTSKSNSTEPRRPVIIKKTAPFRQTSNKNKKKPFKWTFFAIFLAAFYFVFSENFSTPFSEQKNNYYDGTIRSPENNDRTTQSNTKYSLQESSVEAIDQKEEIEHVDMFFSNGSSMGDVVLIQGVPTTTKDNTWYYGKSEVYFHEGKVTHWTRSAENPLKAQLNIK